MKCLIWIVILSVIGLFGYSFYGSYLNYKEQKAKHEAKKKLDGEIRTTKEIMKCILESEEEFSKHIAFPKCDAWLTEIASQVGYEESDVFGRPNTVKYVYLWSAGPDKTYFTDDDIHMSKEALNWNSVGKRFGKASRELIKGIFNK